MMRVQWNKRSLRLIFRIIVASLMRDMHFEAIWGYIGNCLAKITCLSDFPLCLLKTHGIHVHGIECEFSSNCLPLIGPDSWSQLDQFYWLQLRKCRIYIYHHIIRDKNYFQLIVHCSRSLGIILTGYFWNE